MDTYRSKNPSPKVKKKCRRHPRVDAAPNHDLCSNCLAADSLATSVTGAKRPPQKK
jgi:hypothetical protein